MSADKPVIHLYTHVKCKEKTSFITVHSEVVHAFLFFGQLSKGL
jgi:hypothetical protein